VADSDERTSELPQVASAPYRPTGRIAQTGDAAEIVNVSIGPKFLQLFSEQLYSSPNKAFEELVSNSWDAGATAVYVGLSPSLKHGSTSNVERPARQVAHVRRV
jgi:hypothetical protein